MHNILPITICLLFAVTFSQAQPAYDYSQPFLATSQLGFLPSSPKEITFFAGDTAQQFPDAIPFYVIKVGYRLPRATPAPEAWGNPVFRWPFEIDEGEYIAGDGSSKDGTILHQGTLNKTQTRWGTLWRGDFSGFTTPGIYQIETQYNFTVPFQIDEQVYERLERGYLEYMYSQRSGMEIPGIRPLENADDGVLDVDSTYYLPVAGGWNDAGDWRKWLFLTLPNLDALGQIASAGHPAFRQSALEEMQWGNRYFHHMITDSGRVYEDTGVGYNRAGEYSSSWWNENHPGVTAAGDLDSDNIPMNGHERHVRSNYNPLVQFQFVRHQALASTVMGGPHRSNNLVLADRAWRYGQQRAHDQRTIFVSEELLAALELYHAGGPYVSKEDIRTLAQKVLERQYRSETGLSGYFMEKDEADGYRSIAFPAEPALALLRLCELQIEGLEAVTSQAKEAVFAYFNDYLLKDAKSNPFAIPPYGVYVDPPYTQEQTFRDAGNGRFVRTFIHVFSPTPIPHGNGGGLLQQGYALARAGKFFEQQPWKDAAEKILQWSTGHNTTGLCLFTGVGFKHPVPASFMNYKIPSGVSVGFFGRPDDTPYLETSNAIEWSTQEIWDVPYFYTIGLICYLQ